jgi:hypothetical protein
MTIECPVYWTCRHALHSIKGIAIGQPVFMGWAYVGIEGPPMGRLHRALKKQQNEAIPNVLVGHLKHLKYLLSSKNC